MPEPVQHDEEGRGRRVTGDAFANNAIAAKKMQTPARNSARGARCPRSALAGRRHFGLSAVPEEPPRRTLFSASYNIPAAARP